MDRKTAADFDPELLILFDAYVHGAIDRRGFLDKARKYAVGGVTATMLLDALNPKFAEAQKVSPDDTRLATSRVDYPSPQGYGKMQGYLVRPAGNTSKLPSILVVHENRGLNPHIEDIARRIALDGYMAFAPDALFPVGGYPGDEDKARELFRTLDQAKSREDFVAAANYLRTRPDSNGRLGAVGFCYGGAIVNMLATRVPELLAGVPFYGGPAPAEDVGKIKAALLLQFAENDERVNAGWATYEPLLKAAKVPYEAHIYPGTQHGFNNDTTPRYDEKAAALAWERTTAFFAKHLKA
jgi:carboxymethylenebutenolidase